MGNKHIILYLSQKGATNDKIKWTRPNLIKKYFCALRCLENIEKHTQKRQQSKQFWKMLQHFWQTLTLALIKVRSLLEYSCSTLISFKIMVIFNITWADFVLMSTFLSKNEQTNSPLLLWYLVFVCLLEEIVDTKKKFQN